MPKIGRWITVSVWAGDTPAGPASTDRTGAATDRVARRRITVSLVSTVTLGGAAEDTRVPASTVMSAGAGVVRRKTTSPVAWVMPRRLTPTSAAMASRSLLVAVLTNAALCTSSSWVDSMASSRA